MNPQFPGIPVRLDLLGLPGDILGLTILHVALARADLPVGVEPDAVGRVDVDALDLAGEFLLLDEGSHGEKTVAEDQAVGPVLLMAVEVDPLGEIGRTAEPG